jgi:hypothetical protein
MRAKVGDRLVILGHRVGERERDAKILEVRGEHGAPPYLVEWSDDGHISLLFPGPDAVIDRPGRAHARFVKS